MRYGKKERSYTEDLDLQVNASMTICADLDCHRLKEIFLAEISGVLIYQGPTASINSTFRDQI
jgi:hypothetical protein